MVQPQKVKTKKNWFQHLLHIVKLWLNSNFEILDLIVILLSCDSWKMSYFNIYKNVVLYELKFITTQYQFINFSYCLFYGCWNVTKVQLFIICFIHLLHKVSFLLYISYLYYMFYYIFIMYLYVYCMFFLILLCISIFTLFDFKFVW